MFLYFVNVTALSGVSLSFDMMIFDSDPGNTTTTLHADDTDTAVELSAAPSEKNVKSENGEASSDRDHIPKRLTLSFRNLTVRVTAPDEALGETLWSRADPRQLMGLFDWKERPARVIIPSKGGMKNVMIGSRELRQIARLYSVR